MSSRERGFRIHREDLNKARAINLCAFFIVSTIVIFLAVAAYGAVVDVVISPYGGITDTPCFVDVHGDGTKKLAYASMTVNDDETRGHFLVLQELDGTDLNGWPYHFPEGEWYGGGMVLYDIDKDGKEEIIIKGGGKRGYFCKVLKHTETGPVILHDLPIDAADLPASGFPGSFWSSKVVVGDIDNDSEAELIAYQHVFDLDGKRKSLVEGIGSVEMVFVIGTPMVVEDNGNSFIVFHAVEVPDLSNLENFTHALYCIRINWESTNEIIWRHEIGKGDYLTYISNWGELGAADLDGDSQAEVVATAGIDNYKFEFRVIEMDGTVANAARFDDFSCDPDDHTGFIIADIGGGNPSIVFYPGFSGIDYYNTPQSQPACSDVDGDGILDFFVRGWHGTKATPQWETHDCFFKLSPGLLEPPSSPYEPVIYPLIIDNVKEIFTTAGRTGGHHAWYLSHLALADTENNGYFSLVGVTPDGAGLDVVNFDTQGSDFSDWPQAYGNSFRTNSFVLEDEISIELNGTEWDFGVGLGQSTKNIGPDFLPMHFITNKGDVRIDIDIGYGYTSGCKAGTAPDIDMFSIIYGYEAGQPILPEERVVVEKGVVPGKERDVPLVYYAPTGLTNDISKVSAIIEFRAYKEVE